MPAQVWYSYGMTKNGGRKTNKSGQKARSVAHFSGEVMPGGIGGLFAGRAVVALLRLFVLHPNRDFYQRELTDLTGERLFLIQRGLARLVRAGLIDRTSRGNRVYYRTNQSHPAFEDLKALIFKTVGLGDTLRAQLGRLGDRVKVAFLYGSVARGEETASSDIDVMLIGNLSGREVATIFAPVKKMLNREINPSVYNAAEFRKKVRERHPFVTAVLREPKLFLLGDERGLEAVLSRRSA